MKLNSTLAKANTFLLFLAFFFYSSQLKAQNSLTVSGKITDENGKGVPSVTIHVKGTNNQTTSLEDGAFKIAGVKGNDVLVFSSVGYTEQEIPVKNQSVINLSLDISQKTLNGNAVRATRIYPLKNAAGKLLPNSYLLCFEEAKNGDYNVSFRNIWIREL